MILMANKIVYVPDHGYYYIRDILDAYKKMGYIEDYLPLRNGVRELVRGVEITGEIHRESIRNEKKIPESDETDL